MNWQTPMALMIVALTVAIFLWQRFRPRRDRFAKAFPCGCAGQVPGSRPPGYVVQGRKGEPARVQFQTGGGSLRAKP